MSLSLHTKAHKRPPQPLQPRDMNVAHPHFGSAFGERSSVQGGGAQLHKHQHHHHHQHQQQHQHHQQQQQQQQQQQPGAMFGGLNSNAAPYSPVYLQQATAGSPTLGGAPASAAQSSAAAAVAPSAAASSASATAAAAAAAAPPGQRKVPNTLKLPSTAVLNDQGAWEETDPHRLAQRKKQLCFGKVTEGYANYTAAVRRDERQEGNEMHPYTPRVNQVCSKRSWDMQVGKWRRSLHHWDSAPPAEAMRKAPEDLKPAREFQPRLVANPAVAPAHQPPIVVKYTVRGETVCHLLTVLLQTTYSALCARLEPKVGRVATLFYCDADGDHVIVDDDSSLRAYLELVEAASPAPKLSVETLTHALQSVSVTLSRDQKQRLSEVCNNHNNSINQKILYDITLCFVHAKTQKNIFICLNINIKKHTHTHTHTHTQFLPMDMAAVIGSGPSRPDPEEGHTGHPHYPYKGRSSHTSKLPYGLSLHNPANTTPQQRRKPLPELMDLVTPTPEGKV